jgi:hypothetical protein
VIDIKRRKTTKKQKRKYRHHKKYKHGVHQTGKSINRLDAQRKSKKPGKRISKKHKRYYEYRKNRSDMPGKWV